MAPDEEETRQVVTGLILSQKNEMPQKMKVKILKLT